MPKRGRHRFVVAYWPWSAFLERFGFDGITMPWRSIYLRPECFENADLRRHELAHIVQLDRDGTIRFCMLYLWWLVIYGYWDNPYEVEARKSEVRSRPRKEVSR